MNKIFFGLSQKYDLVDILNKEIDDLKIGFLKLADWREIRDKLGEIVIEKLKWKAIIEDCIKIALSKGFLPTQEYMEYCIDCRKKL